MRKHAGDLDIIIGKTSFTNLKGKEKEMENFKVEGT